MDLPLNSTTKNPGSFLPGLFEIDSQINRYYQLR